VIFYYLWKLGFFARADGEKLRFFLGLSPDPLFLTPLNYFPPREIQLGMRVVF